jgi:lysozyme
VNTLRDLIRRFEGLRLKAYLCPAGVWTVGYGSTGPGIGPGVTWTKEVAEQRMQEQAKTFAQGAISMCPVLPPQGEAKTAAIADFAYNLGLTRLKGSTLRRKVNAQDWEGAAEELRKWVYGGGVKLPGLVLRREVEARLLRE